MVEALKELTLTFESFKSDEVLRVTLRVGRNVPFVSSTWPSLVVLWLSRRYTVITSYFSLVGDDSFVVSALIRSDKEFFRQWSSNSLLEYVRRIVK